MTQKLKKMSLIMVNNGKIWKQFRSLRSGINISFGWVLVVVAAVFGLILGAGSTLSTLLAVWLGYKLLRLIFRVFRLVFSLIFSVVSIIVVMLILSFLIF
jgi:hypothetical protein